MSDELIINNVGEFYDSLEMIAPPDTILVGVTKKLEVFWRQFPIGFCKKTGKTLDKFRHKVFGAKDILLTEYGVDNVRKNENEYRWLYNELSDLKSKKTLLCLLQFRATANYEVLHKESDNLGNQYFDPDIIKFNKEEIFVDCGGYIGDTTDQFIEHVGNFNKIYLYEPNPVNYDEAIVNLSKWGKSLSDKIICRKAGVGRDNKIQKISIEGACSKISIDGNSDVDVVALDADIKESVTFIKMDIEGSEIDALMGAKKHLLSEKPKLAICVYHKPDDLWEIPKLILKLNPSYNIYLRQYKYGDGLNAFDTVLYAV
ncbi:MAG: FkbM family methyltransferase [Candidatus Cloacimonetes bacterium]|nr:FkbM family methyltransferase [Candidatus Cloacimonadota bacterium]